MFGNGTFFVKSIAVGSGKLMFTERDFFVLFVLFQLILSALPALVRYVSPAEEIVYWQTHDCSWFPCVLRESLNRIFTKLASVEA